MQVRLKLALQFSMHASGSELEETEQCLAVFITGLPSFFCYCISAENAVPAYLSFEENKAKRVFGARTGFWRKGNFRVQQ